MKYLPGDLVVAVGSPATVWTSVTDEMKISGTLFIHDTAIVISTNIKSNNHDAEWTDWTLVLVSKNSKLGYVPIGWVKRLP